MFPILQIQIFYIFCVVLLSPCMAVFPVNVSFVFPPSLHPPVAFVHVPPPVRTKRTTNHNRRAQIQAGVCVWWGPPIKVHAGERDDSHSHFHTDLHTHMQAPAGWTALSLCIIQRDVSPVSGSREGVVTSWRANDSTSEKMKTRRSKTSKGWTLSCLWTCQLLPVFITQDSELLSSIWCRRQNTSERRQKTEWDTDTFLLSGCEWANQVTINPNSTSKARLMEPVFLGECLRCCSFSLGLGVSRFVKKKEHVLV